MNPNNRVFIRNIRNIVAIFSIGRIFFHFVSKYSYETGDSDKHATCAYVRIDLKLRSRYLIFEYAF